MPNRIIKSLDCRKIISIFCILEVDIAITVITLFVVFNEAFQKALVDKSVCVINIVNLIVLSSTKKPLFDVYFNRVTALFASRFCLLCGHIWGPPHSLQVCFCLLWRHIWFPLHSLQVCFCLLWRHIWLPLHSLQKDFCLSWRHN